MEYKPILKVAKVSNGFIVSSDMEDKVFETLEGAMAYINQILLG